MTKWLNFVHKFKHLGFQGPGHFKHKLSKFKIAKWYYVFWKKSSIFGYKPKILLRLKYVVILLC